MFGKFTRSYITDYIFGTNSQRKWYKFEKEINKTIRKDLKHIKKHKIFTNLYKQRSYEKYMTYTIGKHETYWRVYFVYYDYAYVVYNTPDGGVFIEKLIEFGSDFDNLYPCHYSSSFMSKSRFVSKLSMLNYINDWITENTFEDDGYTVLK